jgi:hypothetical protein
VPRLRENANAEAACAEVPRRREDGRRRRYRGFLQCEWVVMGGLSLASVRKWSNEKHLAVVVVVLIFAGYAAWEDACML